MKDFLNYASEMYYKGTPIISDEEFDVLFQHFGLDDVGHRVTDGISHYYRMYSLQKYFDINDAPSTEGYVITPKLDGAAVSLLYVSGVLKLALTRGDGIQGRDITDKLATLAPEQLTGVLSKGIYQITGEVVCPSSIQNARNVASGSLNLKDILEFCSRPLTFVAYDIQGIEFENWTEAMRALRLEGFHTVDQFDATEYPTDGLVYRVNNYAKYDEMGYTSHHPRGAFALKSQKEGVITTLKDVVWQVGKSGVVSPVAILEPILVGDAMVSKATLHNIEYINSLNLEIGCKVEVIRSGEIIPRILRRVD